MTEKEFIFNLYKDEKFFTKEMNDKINKKIEENSIPLKTNFLDYYR